MNRKNSFARLLSAGLFLSAALATARAQVQFTVNNITGDNDVLAVSGGNVLIGAYSIGQGSNGGTVNGVTFTAVAPSGTSTALGSNITLSSTAGMGGAPYGASTGGGAFAALPSDYQAIISQSTYSDSAAPLVVTLSNLTVGANYTANFWFQYSDGAYGNNDTVAVGATTSGAAYWNYNYSVLNDSSAGGNGAGQFITATFTATSSSEVFDLTGADAGSPITPIISALEVVESVPEPSTVALMTGAIGLFTLLSVRRLRLAAA
jgi:hypothetical protein